GDTGRLSRSRWCQVEGVARPPEEGAVVHEGAPAEAVLGEQEPGRLHVGGPAKDQGGLAPLVPRLMGLEAGVGEHQVEGAPAHHGLDRGLAVEGKGAQLVAHLAALQVHAAQLADAPPEPEEAAQLAYLQPTAPARGDDLEPGSTRRQQGLDETCGAVPEQVAPGTYECAVDVDVQDAGSRGARRVLPPRRSSQPPSFVG